MRTGRALRVRYILSMLERIAGLSTRALSAYRGAAEPQRSDARDPDPPSGRGDTIDRRGAPPRLAHPLRIQSLRQDLAYVPTMPCHEVLQAAV